MKQITYRMLDALGRTLGRQISISELARAIRKLRGSAYYKNIYDETKSLRKQGIITINESGNSCLLSLNPSCSGIADVMAEAEIIRKRELLAGRENRMLLAADIEAEFRAGHAISAIAMINPEQNFRLNRAELLFILQETCDSDEREGILLKARGLEKKHGTIIDCILLNEQKLIEMLSNGEANPLKAMLMDKIAISSPQAFWAVLMQAMKEGRRILLQEYIKPKEDDLMHNMARLGYREIGWKPEKAMDYSIEPLIAEILAKGSARMNEAVPILLAKNPLDYSLLIFLCRRTRLAGKLLGILSAMKKIKSSKELEIAIRIIYGIYGEKEIKADEKSIRQKMRLYSAWQ
ncbi:MAG: hypothetical protein QME12_00120 [Nanoarchaeota archaeon]|nr:hypothetical protein [Nanoarchaeota archaeon]